ncbi:MAG: class I SAM-dependent methyltransferase, partial [Methanobrevibacter sp.]|nr:class I SAM-dependent methyltransferase [Methanobrevibacter sp.]
MINISNCNIKKIDWNECWNNNYKDAHKKGHQHKKTWNDNAKDFNLWEKHDDYPEKLVNNMELDKNDSVLDLGSGTGSVTMKIASKVKKVIAVDNYKNMLDFLEKKANSAGIKNIEYVEADINDISLESIGNYDVVIASRSIAGIKDVKNRFIEFDKIANKGVYFSLIGSQPDFHIKKVSELLNYKYKQLTSSIYAYNILFQLGIYANMINLECNTQHQYEDIYDAYSRLDWKFKGIKDHEKDIVMDFLKENLFENENGKLVNKLNKPDWVLIWWKKQINQYD